MASPLAAGLITRAAVQGDAYWALTGYNTQIADAESIGSGIAGGLGCGTATNVPACLRALPADDDRARSGRDGRSAVGRRRRSAAVTARARRRTVPGDSAAGRLRSRGGLDLRVAVPRRPVHEPELGPHHESARRPTARGEGARPVPEPASTSRRSGPTSRWPRMRSAAVLRAALRTRMSLTPPTYRYLYTHVLENDPFYAQFKAFHGAEDVSPVGTRASTRRRRASSCSHNR